MKEKIESEPGKILGTLDGDRIAFHSAVISAHTAGAGHRRTHDHGVDRLRAGSGGARRRQRIAHVGGADRRASSPSAPPDPIEVEDTGFRPQPRLDVDRGAGMTVTVGRIRKCPLLGTKFVAMGHNTVGSCWRRCAERRVDARGRLAGGRLMRPLVMKFGGTSVADAAAIGRVVASSNAASQGPTVVVVSAMSGMTDELLHVPARPHGARRGNRRQVSNIEARHREAVAELFPGRTGRSVRRAPGDL